MNISDIKEKHLAQVKEFKPIVNANRWMPGFKSTESQIYFWGAEDNWIQDNNEPEYKGALYYLTDYKLAISLQVDGYGIIIGFKDETDVYMICKHQY